MKKVLQIIKSTIIGGILFLVPVVLLIVIIEKAFNISQKIITPFTRQFSGKYVAGIAMQEFIVIVLLLLICFIAGLLASAKAASNFVATIETYILNHVPGYMFLKKVGEGMIGIEDKNDLKVVLVKVDDAWQLAFLIEQVNEGLFTVFVPDAPSLWSGAVYYIEKDKMRLTDITHKQAIASLRGLGFGSGELIRKNLDIQH